MDEAAAVRSWYGANKLRRVANQRWQLECPNQRSALARSMIDRLLASHRPSPLRTAATLGAKRMDTVTYRAGSLAVETYTSVSNDSSMITVSLTLRNGAQRGQRIAINDDQFLIGRHVGCDLRLGGDNVSRRHCLILLDSSGASIQDLNSRNGTLVNGARLNRKEPCQLKHHDKIKIGDWKFRISIRDAKTKQPVDADNLSRRAPTTDHSATPTPEQHVEPAETLESASKTSETPLTEITQELSLELDALAIELGVEPDDRPAAAPAESNVGPQDDEAETSDTVAASTAAATIGIEPAATNDKEDSEAEESETGPKPLPKHLRPQGPADSRDAARQALKRYFGNI